MIVILTFDTTSLFLSLLFPFEMPHVSSPNATPQQPKYQPFHLLRYGISVIQPCETDDAIEVNRQKSKVTPSFLEQIVQKHLALNTTGIHILF